MYPTDRVAFRAARRLTDEWPKVSAAGQLGVRKVRRSEFEKQKRSRSRALSLSLSIFISDDRSSLPESFDSGRCFFLFVLRIFSLLLPLIYCPKITVFSLCIELMRKRESKKSTKLFYYRFFDDTLPRKIWVFGCSFCYLDLTDLLISALRFGFNFRYSTLSFAQRLLLSSPAQLRLQLSLLSLEVLFSDLALNSLCLLQKLPPTAVSLTRRAA